MPDLKHLLAWHHLPDQRWQQLLERTLHHRANREWNADARGRSIGLLFFDPSLRTRASMELAAAELGAFSSSIVPGQGAWSFAWEREGVMDGPEAEHIEEAVAVLSRYYDAIGVRLFASMTDFDADRSDARLRQFVDAATVPVINLESAFWHPCQELADASAIHQRFGGRSEGRRFILAWAYHPKALPMAVPNSALMAAARSGMDIVLARPNGFELDEDVISMVEHTARQSGGAFSETTSIDDACSGADVVYAKAWGGRLAYSDPEMETEQRHEHRDWRITAERMASTNHGAFMHCLPVRRNVVVDTEVLMGDSTLHLDQAENRLHAQKAILEYVWNLI